ncbi:MAG: hypothetical protein ACPL7E_02640, partial [bacterium]
MKGLVLLWLSKDKKQSLKKGKELIQSLLRKEFAVRLEQEIADSLNLPQLAMREEELGKVELVVVGGGNGTIL